MTESRYFIDTSALFKRYVHESGSKVMDRIFGGENLLYISALTLVEVMSNLRRLVDVDRVLSEKEFRQAKASILHDVHALNLVLIEVTAKVLTRSLDICSEAYVTPIDAVQLATALSVEGNPVFLCADVKLNGVADRLGLQTLNPGVTG